jgi:hypothetical protein
MLSKFVKQIFGPVETLAFFENRREQSVSHCRDRPPRSVTGRGKEKTRATPMAANRMP